MLTIGQVLGHLVNDMVAIEGALRECKGVFAPLVQGGLRGLKIGLKGIANGLRRWVARKAQVVLANEVCGVTSQNAQQGTACGNVGLELGRERHCEFGFERDDEYIGFGKTLGHFGLRFASGQEDVLVVVGGHLLAKGFERNATADEMEFGIGRIEFAKDLNEHL